MRWWVLTALLVLGCDDEAETETPADAGADGAGGAAADGMAAGGDGAALDGAIPDGATPDVAVADGSVDPDAAADGAPDAAPVDPDGGADAAPDGLAVDAGADAAEIPDGPIVDGAPEADAAPADNCDACGDDAECAALGDGAICALGRCAARCEGDDDCPPSFSCLLNQCAPAGFNCEGCAVTGCPEGQRCGGGGMCEARGGRCGVCADDAECEDGLSCRQVGASRNCIEACDEGACAEGFECDNGGCQPVSGVCDLCGGCVGDRPLCDVVSRECRACGIGTPCADGLVCTPEGECELPEMGVQCLTGLDCRDAERPLCEENQCIGCRDDAWCVVGESCVEGGCTPGDACTGVACQGELECAAGVCEGGCADDDDCGDEALRCNADTGQCHRADQRCDLDGAASVCAPGGVCRADPVDANNTVCTCRRTDPNNFFEPNEDHLVPCQPGGICLQVGADPGVCIRAP